MGNEKEELNNLLHTHLCEIMPDVCEDSGQAEWSRGELQKMIDAFMSITEYWKVKAELSEARKEIVGYKEMIKNLEVNLMNHIRKECYGCNYCGTNS